MVYKCFVYGCKTHKIPKNTTFGIPKEPELVRQWETALRPYGNGKILQSKHRVCKAHFRPEEIESFYNHLIQGTEVKIERGRPELKKGAVPSIFPGQKKPPRRILVYKSEEREKKAQHILLLNGEWVHVEKPDTPAPPVRKRTNKPKVDTSSTIVGKSKKGNTPSKNSAENFCEVVLDSTSKKPSEHASDHIESGLLSSAGLSPVKPPDRELPSICINWDALPLPEEIGSFLCDSLVPHISSNSDFHVQSLKPSSAPSSLPPKDFPIEQLPEEPLSTTDNVTGSMQEQGQGYTLSFRRFLQAILQIQLPSSMWALHTDNARVFFSCMSHTSYTAVPKVEKIVMYEGNMTPRVFLRGLEVYTLISEKRSTSIADVQEALCQVDRLKLCLGIDSPKDVISYSSNCEIFVESGRLPHCPACKIERSVERSKKRHLETDSFTSSLLRLPKKKQSTAK